MENISVSWIKKHIQENTCKLKRDKFFISESSIELAINTLYNNVEEIQA